MDQIEDAGNKSYGFIDADYDSEYTYDANGNMIMDKNKGIISITYNHLNLPEVIKFEDNLRIEYLYNANGVKLQKRYYVNNLLNTTTDYSGEFVYTNRSIDYISIAEGRLKKGTNGTYTPEFFLKDHLGNVRVVLSSPTTVTQVTDYYPFGMEIPVSGSVSLNSNQLKYNSKELQTEADLQWYDYGARFYDPQIGRWHAVDQLAESYFNYSPYCYVGDNPVKRIDPDGRYWEDEEDKGTATELRNLYMNIMAYYEKKEQRLQGRINKGKNVEKNTMRRERASEFKNEMSDAICEIDAMGTDDKTAFTFNKVEEGITPLLEHGVASNGVDLLITINHYGSMESKTHESKHAYQALNGEMVPGKRGSTFWDPQHDQIETEAYRRQCIINSITMPYMNNGNYFFPVVNQMGFNDITKDNVMNIFIVPAGVLPKDAARNPKNYLYRKHGN